MQIAKTKTKAFYGYASTLVRKYGLYNMIPSLSAISPRIHHLSVQFLLSHKTTKMDSLLERELSNTKLPSSIQPKENYLPHQYY